MNTTTNGRSHFVMQSDIETPRSVVKTRRVLRAAHLGMCFGVRDAIALAHRTAAEKPLTILGELVHNRDVVQKLEAAGVTVAPNPDSVHTETVMVTAHGASDAAIASLRGRGLEVIEATCPLVHHAHKAIRQLAGKDYHPIIIGKRGHVEVRGLTEDLAACDVVLEESDIAALKAHSRFGVISQTTQPIERVRHLVNLIRQRFSESEVRFIDTVCQPTKQRQLAAVELAKQCDVVVVVGGTTSNNTRELAETCGKWCARVVRVEGAGELQREWFDGVSAIGLTAGTSTPDEVIEAVGHWLEFLPQ